MSDFTNMPAIFMAAIVSEFCTHPFEVIKTRKQIKYGFASSGIQVPSQFSTLQRYIKNGAAKDLYKGFSPAIIKGIQIQTIRFGLYDAMNNFLRRTFLPGDASGQTNFCFKLASAFTSSVVAGITTNPWMIIKVRMIADKSGEYKTLRQSFKSITKTSGYQELLKGTSLAMVRGTVLSTVELTMYDTFKTLFTKKEGLDFRASLKASIIASLSGAVVSYPFDILRTLYTVENSRNMKENRGLRQIMKIVGGVYQNRGLKGFYQGFMPYLSKSLIYGPLFWNTLELCNYLCKSSIFQFGKSSNRE